jgi:hypothetical protein
MRHLQVFVHYDFKLLRARLQCSLNILDVLVLGAPIPIESTVDAIADWQSRI